MVTYDAANPLPPIALPAAAPYAPAESDSLDAAAVARYSAENVVRPVLAVLFRVAIGPKADRYTPRFLAFEKSGGPRAGWHWPSLIAPSLWAFYRRLWVSGLCFAVLRLAALVAFLTLGPSFDESPATWLALGALVVLVLPSIVPAAFADWLLYRRVRSLVRRAESHTRNAAEALAWLDARMPTAAGAAVLLTFALSCAAIATLGPSVLARYTEHVVRLKVSDTLAAVRWLQQRVEDSLAAGEAPPPVRGMVVAGEGAKLIDALDIHPSSGRVRVGFGDTLPELAGKWILLAPLRDAREHLHWICIPVDIPAKYLPRICGGS
jgi:hypothetical protein